MKENLRTALLISGGGTTAEAVIKACRSGEITGISPVAVISSKPDAPGIKRAQDLGVETFIVERKNFPTPEKFGKELLRILKSLSVDFISQNGWLVLTPENVVREYQGRIINQHPGSLDPGREIDFGGKGMYGARVVCASLLYTWLINEVFNTEATTHFVTPEFDKGDLIRVSKMEVNPLSRRVTIAELFSDESLKKYLVAATKDTQQMLLPLEHRNVIETLKLFTKGEVFGFRRKEPLIPPENKPLVDQTKKLAIRLFPNG